MMKLPLLVIAILNVHIFATSAIEVGLRVLFNKGTPLPSVECNAIEWSNVTSTISTIVKKTRRRNLRQLPTYPSWCAEKCKYIAKGYCQGAHPLCDGYRRLNNGKPISAPATTPELLLAPSPAPAPIRQSLFPKARNLEVTSCAEGITKVNDALDTLAKRVSSQCSSILMAPRDVSCLTTIDNCDIQRMRLMNAETDTVIVESFTSGMSFCTNGPLFTFEAINDKCVCNVKFNLKNSAGQVIYSRLESYRPFVVYSNSAPNAQGVVDLYGNRLPVGAYTLEYYPDDNTGMTSQIAFNVNQC